MVVEKSLSSADGLDILAAPEHTNQTPKILRNQLPWPERDTYITSLPLMYSLSLKIDQWLPDIRFDAPQPIPSSFALSVSIHPNILST